MNFPNYTHLNLNLELIQKFAFRQQTEYQEKERGKKADARKRIQNDGKKI